VAAAITKEVFNPLAKLTKGLQNVVLSKGQAKNEQVIELFFPCQHWKGQGRYTNRLERLPREGVK
jgi:hypothetical protein